jgi:hypothetical protein
MVRLQVRQLFARIKLRVDLRMGLHDAAVFADHIRDAASVFILLVVRCAVGDPDLSSRVRDQRELKIILRREALVLLRSVEADADDPRVFLLVFVVEVPEPGTLSRSTRSLRFDEKPEHDFLAAHVAEAHGPPAVIGGLEVGSLVAHLQHTGAAKDSLPDEAKRTTNGHGSYCMHVAD